MSFHSFLIRVGIVFSGRQSPGGHNVIWGLYNALKIHNNRNVLLGFLGMMKNYDLLILGALHESFVVQSSIIDEFLIIIYLKVKLKCTQSTTSSSSHLTIFGIVDYFSRFKELDPKANK